MTTQQDLINRLKKSPSEDDRKQCIALLQAHLASNPADAVAWYDLASCFDFCGFEKEAEPCYWKTYEHGWQKLAADKQSGFFVGFGSTLRNNLEFAKSEKILKEGITHFPTYPALKTFLAFTLHTQGKFKEASEILFAATLEMPEKAFDGYEHPMKFYIENLNTFPVAAPEALQS
jgi:tetratricopeptide (TPR) repeat protein